MREVFRALILFIGIFITVGLFFRFKKGVSKTFDKMSDFVEKRGLFVRNNPCKKLTYQPVKTTIYL